MGVFNTIFCFSVICFVSAWAQQTQTNFELVKGKKVVNAITRIQSVSQFDCAASCLKLAGNGECKVAGYHSGSMKCHISNMVETVVENASDEWTLLITETGLKEKINFNFKGV